MCGSSAGGERAPGIGRTRGGRGMTGVVRVGTVGEAQFVVAEEHLIDFAHDGMPQILSTPSLIWFLEHAARNAVLPLLERGESTVGVVVNVEHTAPTPPGARSSAARG